tara:strand:+ start:197 stop:385 length:189 start_codon:yes stop_codon:yes gene_type:complete
MTEQELQEKLVDLDDEYEYSVSVGTIRTPEEIANEVYSVIKQLGWTEDEAYDYLDFVKRRYD